MPAMLLAAGRGERMGTLSMRLPKALLRVGGRALIEHHLTALAGAGVSEVVVNTARLGPLIRASLGDGRRYGLRIRYSNEGKQPLETAGGIVQALPLLGPEFLVVNADVWTDFDFRALRPAQSSLAHLVLVDNPSHHPQGDFALQGERLNNGMEARLTYAGIGIFRAELFAGLPAAPTPLAPLLRSAADAGRATGQRHSGAWLDVGTAERLAQLRKRLASRHGANR